jgi:type IV secretory pathway VirB10-like protein
MSDPAVPQVRDLRARITGLLPQNMQARVLGGIALLMTVVIVFSGRKPVREIRSTPVAGASVVDPNQARIQDYRARIEEQTQKLAAEEAQLTQAKQTLEVPPSASPSATPTGGRPFSGRIESEPQSKKGDPSLFASNIALTYRPTQPGAAVSGGRAMASQGRDTTDGSDTTNSIGAGLDPASDTPARTYRLWEGTVMEAVLTNRLDSSFSGPVNCMVTTNLYAPDTGVLVIPQGTRVLGEVRKLENMGEQRLAVFFHRLIRPDFYTVSLDRFQGLNQIGETGLRDLVNHHYAQVFGAAIGIGAIAGLAQAGTRYGANPSAADVYEQGVSGSLAQSSTHILDRYLNILPTFTIREGQRIKIYLSQDLTLPAYDPHPQ